jgi:hypothetical protein
VSAGTTKGTGGDIIILEEAAYVDQNFFYETVAPLLLIGVTSLICISTLTSELNFYTRLFKIKDPVTNQPVFAQLQISLACNACKELGLAAQCKHLLHLVPQWQSSVRHERLKAVMADRPDLIQSELAGLAFDSLQQCFRTADIESVMSSKCPELDWQQPLFMVIDPAAGGPQSDFALITFFRSRGIICVSIFLFISYDKTGYDRMYSTLICLSKSSISILSLIKKFGMISSRKTVKNLNAFCWQMGFNPIF